IDCTLRPSRYRFRFVTCDVAKSEAGDKSRELVGGTAINREFDEFDTKAFRSRRHLWNIGSGSSVLFAQLIHEIDQRPLAIDSDRTWRTGAELVVEYLQRQVALVAGRLDRRHEIEERHVALPRETAEMPAPVQHVHVEPRRVGKLGEEYPRGGYCMQRLEIGLAGVSVETVEHKPDRPVVGSPHHFPGVTVIVDMTAPGQRLKTHAQAMLCRAFAKFAKIGGAAIDAAKGFRRHIAAHQQQVAGQFLHEIELAFSTVEGALTLRVRHAFEIAERLERDRPQPEIRDFLP